MRRLKGILVLVLLLALITSPIAVLASDISGALYYGTIIVSNDSTATNAVAVNCTISTQALIDGGYLNSSANNCVVRSSAGADLPFMPAVNASYPWCIWVPSIGQNSHLSDILYTANSTGGEIRYFPASGGMVTVDSLSMELGDNFTIDQNGWVNTDSGANKNLVHKMGAYATYISGSENISASLLVGDGFEYTDSPGNHGYTLQGSPVTTTDQAHEGSRSLKTDSNAEIQRVQADFSSREYPIDVYYYDDNDVSAWQLLFIYDDTTDFTVGVNTAVSGVQYSYWDGANHASGVARGVGWHRFQVNIDSNGVDLIIDGTPVTTDNARLTSFDRVFLQGHNGAASIGYWDAFDFGNDFYGTTVTAQSISSGEHIVRTSANLTHLAIFVDDMVTPKDSTVLTANITDNYQTWTFLQNDTLMYLENQIITINGTQVQYIDWEYDTTFSDNSSFGNDATPTFRTASSDADVSAVLSSFLPIAEAKAPAYALADAPAFIETVPTIVSVFDTTPPAGTFPLAGVIVVVANATATPPQLPLLIIACLVIFGMSFWVSASLRRYGSGSLIIKIAVITALMGIFIAIENFGIDFWMLFIFLVIATALAMGSKQVGWQ